MMNQTYYLQMSSGCIHRCEFATSAGEAIYQALFVHRGATVTACWQGPSIQDPRYGPGYINYEVPEHQPIPLDAKKPSNRRPKDQTEVMGFMEEVA
jgi:hypothetical protein